MHGDLGSSSVWRVLLEGCHAAWWSALLKRISLELEDEMFFRGKSKSPPVELWTSLIGAMGRRSFQEKFSISVVRSLSCLATRQLIGAEI